MKSTLASIAATAGMVAAAGASTSSSSSHATTPSTAQSMPTIQGLLDKDNLPTTGQDWMSITDAAGSRLEYQPNDFADEDPATARRLRAVRDRFLLDGAGRDEYSKQFIDGGETYYDEYAQAWRLLGFYIDCDSPYETQSDCWGYDEDGGGDQEGGQEVQYDKDGNAVRNCVRYLLWAAYVDLDYNGEGIGEYQFFNRHTGNWNTDSCVAESGRCAKFDCHLSNTNFKLLGLFKEPNYHSWMEQLFKHEGVCVWTEEEYEFMQYNRDAWPCGCTQTDQTDDAGNYLYYDMKPLPEGRLTFGLYTDESCVKEYTGSSDPVTVIETYIGDAEGEDGYGTTATLAQNLESWNNAFDIFKKCQPCKAYDLSNDGSSNYNQDDHQETDDGTKFACYDDADYTSVNQCMKFRTKTQMLTANFRDVALASEQGTIVEIELLGTVLGSGGFGRFGRFASAYNYSKDSLGLSEYSLIWFGSSLAALVVGFMVYACARRAEKKQRSGAEEPLVQSSKGVVS